MSAVVTGALLADARRRPGRVLLTGLAVVVATVFTAGTLLLGGTLRAALEARSQVTPAAATAVVEAGGLDAPAGTALVDAVRAAADDAAVVGVWSGAQPVSGRAGLWSLVSDPFGGPLSRLGPVAGRVPTAAGEVAISSGTAARTRLGPRASLTVGGQRVTVTGVVTVPRDGTDTLVGPPATIAALGGTLDQVDVAGATAAALRAGLPPDVGITTGAEQRADEAERGSATAAAVVFGVSVFTALALVAAAVVVASTFRIVLTQRRTQLALLRCVGAGRGAITAAVLAEAVVSGLVAGMLGAGVALAAGYGVVGLLGATLVVSWPGLAGCVLLAVTTTVVAALVPALAAGRTAPVAALGSAAASEVGSPRRRRRTLGAAALLALAALLAAPALAGAEPTVALVAAAASGLAVFAALVAAGPLLTGLLAATVGRLVAAAGGAPGRMAVANAAQVPRRTAATVTVLSLGVGLTSALLVGVASAQSSAERSLDERLPSAVQVVAADPSATGELRARLVAQPALRVQERDGQLFVNPAPGVDDPQLRAAVDRALAGERPVDGEVVVAYTADVRREVTAQLGVLRGVGLGLVGMTLLVAVVGVGVTLTLSVAERTRETGLLRAVGLSRGGVRAMVAWEAALGAAAAAAVGAVLGAAYGLLAARAVGLEVAVATVPVLQLGALAVGVVAVAVVAALAPAVRAGRVPPIRALTA